MNSRVKQDISKTYITLRNISLFRNLNKYILVFITTLFLAIFLKFHDLFKINFLASKLTPTANLNTDICNCQQNVCH